MIITAVVCFTMGMIPGKKVNAKVVKVLTDGQAVSNYTRNNYKDAAFQTVQGSCNIFESARNTSRSVVLELKNYRLHNCIKKVFFWLQGPGDREAEFFKNLYKNGLPAYESPG